MALIISRFQSTDLEQISDIGTGFIYVKKTMRVVNRISGLKGKSKKQK